VVHKPILRRLDVLTSRTIPGFIHAVEGKFAGHVCKAENVVEHVFTRVFTK
jgi:hypothetical protein